MCVIYSIKKIYNNINIYDNKKIYKKTTGWLHYVTTLNTTYRIP